MRIRALCAAAAVAVGVGSAADAATTVDYDLWLRYDGTTYLDAVVNDPVTGENLVFGDIAPGEPTYGLPNFYEGIKIGDIVRFTAKILFPDPPYEPISDPYDNGGEAITCSIGIRGCSGGTFTIPRGKSFRLSWVDYEDLIVDTEVGGSVSHSFWRGYETGDPSYRFQIADFTVVAEPAPVPLPATAALLPLGIGALAMMRRRRRALS